MLAGAAKKARSDVAALVVERARRLSAFEATPGWRVVIEVAAGEPLWPQGFDPRNVERIDAARVLHTRYLRTENGAARVEVLNAEVLTAGRGSHPSFQGVRRVVVTTLLEPAVNDEAGKTSVRAPGLTASAHHHFGAASTYHAQRWRLSVAGARSDLAHERCQVDPIARDLFAMDPHGEEFPSVRRVT